MCWTGTNRLAVWEGDRYNENYWKMSITRKWPSVSVYWLVTPTCGPPLNYKVSLFFDLHPLTPKLTMFHGIFRNKSIPPLDGSSAGGHLMLFFFCARKMRDRGLLLILWSMKHEAGEGSTRAWGHIIVTPSIHQKMEKKSAAKGVAGIDHLIRYSFAEPRVCAIHCFSPSGQVRCGHGLARRHRTSCAPCEIQVTGRRYDH